MIKGPFSVTKGEGYRITILDSDGFLVADYIDSFEMAELFAAAVQARDALLRLEFSGRYMSAYGNEITGVCPGCFGPWANGVSHRESCWIGSVLAAMGLDTESKRDSARKELGL